MQQPSSVPGGESLDVVRRKAQVASVRLADTIGRNFIEFKNLNKPVVIPLQIQISENEHLDQRTEICLQALAKSIGTKYQAVLARQGQQNSSTTIHQQPANPSSSHIQIVQGSQAQVTLPTRPSASRAETTVLYNGTISQRGISPAPAPSGQHIQQGSVQVIRNVSPAPAVSYIQQPGVQVVRSSISPGYSNGRVYSGSAVDMNQQKDSRASHTSIVQSQQAIGNFQPQIYKSQQQINVDTQGGKIISERKYDSVVTTNTYENMRGQLRGQPGVVGPSQMVAINQETGQLKLNTINKEYEVIVENPIIRQIEVPVPYDVYIDKPIENRVEKEVIYERIVENKIERVIERPVEKIRYQQVEQIIEKPVVIEEFVDNVIENVVENRYDVIKEVQQVETVAQDNHIQTTTLRPVRNEVQIKEVIKEVPVRQDVYVPKQYERVVQKVVEQPYDVFVDKEVIVDKPVAVQQDVYVERRVEKPYTKVIDVPEIKKIKRSVVVEKPVDVIIDVVRTVDKPVRRTVDRVVERPVIQERVVEDFRDVVVEKPYYVDKKVEVKREVQVEKEYMVDRYVDKEVVEYVEVPVVQTQEVEVPVEKKVTKYVEVPKEIYRDVDVVKEVVIPVERIVEKRVKRDRIVPKTIEVEKMVEMPYETKVDKIIEYEKEVQVPQYVEKIMEKKVDRIVERRVEVPVEKFVQVPREVYKDKIIDVETTTEKPVYVERHINEQAEVQVSNDNNLRMKRDFQEYEVKIQGLKGEFQRITEQINIMRQAGVSGSTTANYSESRIGYEENMHLRELLNQLHDEYNELVDQHNRWLVEQQTSSMVKKGMGKSFVVQGQASAPLVTNQTMVQSGAPVFRQSQYQTVTPVVNQQFTSSYAGQQTTVKVQSASPVPVRSSFQAPPATLNVSNEHSHSKVVIYGGNDSSMMSNHNGSFSRQAQGSNQMGGFQGGQPIRVQSAYPEPAQTTETVRTFRPTLQGQQIERLSMGKSPVRVSSSNMPIMQGTTTYTTVSGQQPGYRMSSSPAPTYIQSAKVMPTNVIQSRSSGVVYNQPMSIQMIPGQPSPIQTYNMQNSILSYDGRSKTPSQTESRVISNSTGVRNNGSINQGYAHPYPNNLSTITESVADSVKSIPR